MTAARFARLVRFCDERYTARADGLASAARHFEQSRFKSQSNDAEKRQGWPYRGLPIVAVGSHGARGLVMFGVCQSLKWAPNPESSDAQRYPSVIEVAWERTVFEVDPESFPSRPGRSYVGLTRDEYDAWRRAAPPVAYADEIEYVTAPDGAARAADRPRRRRVATLTRKLTPRGGLLNRRAPCDARCMARFDPPADWRPLCTREDWTAHRRGGVLVVHQRNPLRGERTTKYHGRSCSSVRHRVFLDGPATGSANSEWFRAPDAASPKAGGAGACDHCSGES